MTTERAKGDAAVTVVSVEDEGVLQDAIKDVIEREGWRFIPVRDLDSFRQALSEYKPSIAIIDLNLPGGSASGGSTVDVLNEMQALSPSTKRLIFTAFPTAGNFRRALAAGVEGFIQKSGTTTVQFTDVVKRVIGGHRHYDSELVSRFMNLSTPRTDDVEAGLTDREREVLRLVLEEGLGNKAIAERLRIGTETVKTHFRNISDKIGPGNRVEKAVKAKDLGLL